MGFKGSLRESNPGMRRNAQEKEDTKNNNNWDTSS